MPYITIVGNLNMDLVLRVDHLPEPGETILGHDYHTIPGGKGANQAVAAARLGAQVDMVGWGGNARDLAKLRNWENYIQYYGEVAPPVFEHVLVDGSTLEESKTN